jgi:hypothetical protein
MQRGCVRCQMLCVHRSHLRVKRRNLARRTACKTDLHQSKIQNLRVSALGNKKCGGLNVAVDYAGKSMKAVELPGFEQGCWRKSR